MRWHVPVILRLRPPGQSKTLSLHREGKESSVHFYGHLLTLQHSQGQLGAKAWMLRQELILTHSSAPQGNTGMISFPKTVLRAKWRMYIQCLAPALNKH